MIVIRQERYGNYRCIRDLNMKGMDENNLDRKKAPETLFKISSVDPKALTVTFDYLNANSLKPAPSMNELDPHNERDNDINRVYKSFCILGKCVKQSSWWNMEGKNKSYESM